jgi:hypothetical protein
MKMMKLLGAASAAALIAGAANAQLDLILSNVGSPDITSTYSIADEVDFDALSSLTTGDSAIVGMEVLAEGQIPPGQNVLLSVQVNNGVFSTDLIDGTDHVVTGQTGAVVQSGGTAGSNVVQFLVTTDNADTSTVVGRDALGLNLPITVSSCGDVDFQVTQFQTTDTPAQVIEGGTASLSNGLAGVANLPVNAVECDEAFDATLVPDGGTFLSYLTAFTTFWTTADVPAGPTTDTAPGTARLGIFNLDIDGTVNVDLSGTAAAPANVVGYTSTINFTVDDAGIASGVTTGTAGTFFNSTAPDVPAGNAITITEAGAAAVNPETADFSINAVGGTSSMMAQVVNATGSTLSLGGVTGTYLMASDPFNFQDVEDLVFNGSTFGPFDWVADSSGRVNSIFRVTGLSPTMNPIPGLLVLTNSRNGNNGVYPFTVAPTDVEGSEVRYNSTALEGIAGPFGTADVTMVFGAPSLTTGGAALDLDVDRLLSGPSTATVVPFGDNANSDETNGDADQIFPSVEGDDDGNF